MVVTNLPLGQYNWGLNQYKQNTSSTKILNVLQYAT